MNKMFVWRGRDCEYMAVVYAATVAAARKLLTEEIYGEECESTPVICHALKDVQEKTPEIFYRPNAEFVLLASGQRQVQVLYPEMLRKKIAGLEK